jgi:hypothetical protein
MFSLQKCIPVGPLYQRHPNPQPTFNRNPPNGKTFQKQKE